MQIISGPGVGLVLAQNLYPSELNNAPYDTPTNRLCLAGGQSLVLPAGDWYISLGLYCVLQFQDPVTGAWQTNSSESYDRGLKFIKSDGFTVRVANMTGCPISAGVAAYGSGYVQATTTITATPGNSTWLPLVGGQLVLVGGTLTNNGAGYGVAPLVFIPAPPPASNNANGVGGVAAAAYAVIASGTVSGITFTNPGAGYPTAPPVVIVPSPFDPNLSVGITAAAVAMSLTGSGSITGAICTNSGAPLANPANITLTVAGVGSSGSLTAQVMQTVTAGSVSGIGTGFGASAVALLTTVGGVPAAGSIANGPDALYLSWLPRPAQIGLTTNAGGTLTTQAGTIYDGGLFLGTPTGIIGLPTNSNGSVVSGTIALTMGSKQDIVTIQPAP
jgi:hypothetical protein